MNVEENNLKSPQKFEQENPLLRTSQQQQYAESQRSAELPKAHVKKKTNAPKEFEKCEQEPSDSTESMKYAQSPKTHLTKKKKDPSKESYQKYEQKDAACHSNSNEPQQDAESPISYVSRKKKDPSKESNQKYEQKDAACHCNSNEPQQDAESPISYVSRNFKKDPLKESNQELKCKQEDTVCHSNSIELEHRGECPPARKLIRKKRNSSIKKSKLELESQEDMLVHSKEQKTSELSSDEIIKRKSDSKVDDDDYSQSEISSTEKLTENICKSGNKAMLSYLGSNNSKLNSPDGVFLGFSPRPLRPKDNTATPAYKHKVIPKQLKIPSRFSYVVGPSISRSE